MASKGFLEAFDRPAVILLASREPRLVQHGRELRLKEIGLLLLDRVELLLHVVEERGAASLPDRLLEERDRLVDLLGRGAVELACLPDGLCRRLVFPWRRRRRGNLHGGGPLGRGSRARGARDGSSGGT